ncbi:MAG: hypothetical protein ACYCTE_13920 [Acidimicrobiales bacterium]
MMYTADVELFWPTAAQNFVVGHETEVNWTLLETKWGEDQRDPS